MQHRLIKLERDVKWWRESLAVHDDCVASMCMSRAERRNAARQRKKLVARLAKRETALDTAIRDVMNAEAAP